MRRGHGAVVDRCDHGQVKGTVVVITAMAVCRVVADESIGGFCGDGTVAAGAVVSLRGGPLVAGRGVGGRGTRWARVGVLRCPHAAPWGDRRGPCVPGDSVSDVLVSSACLLARAGMGVPSGVGWGVSFFGGEGCGVGVELAKTS